MGSNLCRKIHLLGISHLVVGKQFQVLEVRRGMKLTQDLSYEEKAMLDLFCVLQSLGGKTNFCMCKEQGVVIKLVD